MRAQPGSHAQGMWWALPAIWLAATLGGLPAAQAEELKVGFVNLARVFDGYTKTKTSDAQLQRKGEKKEVELKTRMQELRKMRESLELLNDDARETKALELEEKADELQRFRANTARNLRRERDKAAKELLGDIQDVMETYATERGFTVILDSQSLLYGHKRHDVTDDVLALLNKRAQ